MQKFNLVLKKVTGTRMSVHMVVNKGFFSATAHPEYPQKMLAHLRVFIGVTTVMS